jgi:hypothetical protein
VVAEQVPVHGYRHERGGVDEVRGLWPIGMMGVWRHPLHELPDGFVVCDGTNGTLDMRDYFPMGAGGSYEVGDTGGSETHSHNAHATELVAAEGSVERSPVDASLMHSEESHLPPFKAVYWVERIA